MLSLSLFGSEYKAVGVESLTVGAGALFRQRVAQAGHLVLGLERGLPLGVGQVHGQLVDGGGVQDLGGGVGVGLGRLAAGAVVAGFAGEVDGAVDGAVRQHGAGVVPLTPRVL